jgi:pimeloyl-ACP methyl ester carboxylesterase
VLAWDAPGYGASASVASPEPLAPDYAEVVAEWLLALGVRECTVLGHSLGAMVAACFAAQFAGRHGIVVRALLLASPALGYGDRPEAERSSRWRERVDLVQRLGPAAMAAERAPRLCTEQADGASLGLVEANMARVTPGGYAQAAHMLAFDSLAPCAARVRIPLHVLCGALDRITPAAASGAFADALGAAFHLISGAAHACYVEHAADFNTAVRAILAQVEAEAHHG